MSTCKTSHLTLFTLAFILLALASPSQAQSCEFHRDCNSGQFCDGIDQSPSGVCRSAEAVLSQNGSLFWVNQSGGNDSNPGTQQQPWKTISRATRSNVLRPGDAVLIRGGTYREEVRPREGGSASGGFVTFAAYPGEDVTVTGADVVNRPDQGYNGWKQQNDGSWRHAWVWPALEAEGLFSPDRRRELFVDNGRVLVQQGGQTRPVLENGQFWVDGSDSAPVAVYLKTFNGSNPNQRTMEVGIRKELFYSYDEGDANCGGGSEGYYRLIGLRFVHATTKRQRMAVCPGKQGSRLEEVEVVWNNAGGIKLVGQGHMVRGAVANYNGIEGLAGSRCNGCIVEYSEISYNHWKWPQSYASTHGGGGKWTRTRNSTLRYNRYVGNHGSAIWLDYANYDNKIYGNFVDGSLKQGIMIEQDSDRNRIYNNVIVRTRYYVPIWNGVGISISASDSNLVAYNTLMLNDGTAIRVAGDNRNDAVHTTVYNNLLVDNLQARSSGGERMRSIQVGGKGGPNNGVSPWERARSHRLDGNAYWYRPGNGGADYATFMASPTSPDGSGDLYSNSLSEWQDTGLGYDPDGMVTDLSLPTVVNATNAEDGWVLALNSQYIGHAVALPAGFAPILTDFFGNPRPAFAGSPGAYEALSTPGDDDLPDTAGLFGEAGQVTVRQNNADQWHTVNFQDSFSNPVVVMGPVSYNGPHPSTVRVRNVSPLSFQFQIDEWDYLDGGHTTETISYLVVEAGSHSLPDGTRLVAGHIDGTDDDWKSVNFSPDFSSRPVVLTQCASANGSAAVTVRLRNVTKSAFEVSVQEEESSDSTPAAERISYIAIEPMTDAASGIEAGVTGNNVTDTWTSIDFSLTYQQQPTFLAAIQTYDGSDPSALRYQDLTTSGVAAMVEEEQSSDDEVGHTTEEVGYLLIEPGLLGGLARGTMGPGAEASKSAEGTPHEFALEGNYPNPFSQRTTIRYTLAEATDVRIEVYDALGRRVAVLAESLQEAGPHETSFDGSGLPSGVYLYRLQAGAFVKTQRMVLTK